MLRKLTLALTLASLAGSAHAQVGFAEPGTEPHETNAMLPEGYRVDNAALLYYRYWMIGQAQFPAEIMNEYDGSQPGWRPDEAFRAELVAAQDTIQGYLKASRLPMADWGVEYDEGVMALLPHLGKFRNTARILVADARRLMDDGEIEQAAERIAALYRMGEQTSHDRVLISTLVGVAIAALANTQVEELVATGELTSDARDIILDAMEAIDLDNPAGVRQAVLGERDIFLGMLRHRYTGPIAGEQFVKEILPMLGTSLEGNDKLRETISQYDEAALHADFDKAERYYADILSIWDLPDAGDRIDQLSGLIENGHYGVAGRVMLPAMSKVWESARKIRLELTETRKLLEEARVVMDTDETGG